MEERCGAIDAAHRGGIDSHDSSDSIEAMKHTTRGWGATDEAAADPDRPARRRGNRARRRRAPDRRGR
ncbi:hypothetical protein D0U02_18535 [Burkholderia pseudomallei]|uniref:Uncharacterized protein n=2 Tax=Burkholderia pseudomallei TaxID=28450 RepID=A0AAX0U8N3_BURPE|nr:hypothetical protein BURPS668_A2275 [Burkholderia pseudomallei 668]ARK45012.1 hypothetical protein BOC35_00465 [Burkholderia pseudomallei]EES22827.1 hypothetical protein BURPS1106B_2990 [Burkholderia pseudomallei 1106b]EET05875.1 hypothetical protein BURPS1710A_A1453 [Burkholderia pseudomallei 1710a]ARK57673.1 hypothetical protein BOC36_33120 [Burkholderia pseudomallei]